MNDNFYKQLIKESQACYAYHKIICNSAGIPCDYEFIEVNDAFEKFTGLKGSDIVGKRVTTVLPHIKKSKFDWIHLYGDIAINGGKKEFEQFSESLQRFYKISVYSPEKYYFVTHFIDISKEMNQLSEMTITRVKADKSFKKSEKQFQQMFKNHNAVMLLIEIGSGKILDANFAAEKFYGYSISQLNSMTINQINIMPASDVKKDMDMALREERNHFIFNHKLSNGDICPVEVYSSPINYKETTTLFSIIHDITKRKKLEIALLNEKKLLETTLISVGDGVISTDNKGNIVFLNRVTESLTGWTQEAAIGKPIEEVFNIINEFTRGKCENIVNKVLISGKTAELANHTILISKDGIERPIEDSAAPIMQDTGDILGVVLVFRDVTDKKQRQKEILYLSYHDQLTGLYNRRFYEEELLRLDTARNLPMTIVMGDVNGLKLINDSFGHAVGDELLKKVAKIITNGCRVDDIIARLGGDEFVVLLPKTTTLEADQIIKRIDALALIEKIDDLEISISFGFETKNNDEEKMHDIFKKAEDYMYKKKLFEGPSMRGKTINAIINTLHEKNKREEQHSLRVSILCKSMGEALGLSVYENEELKSVGLLHDIGKIAINEDVLNKPGKLTDDEWKEIKRHPEIGYRILNTVNDMSDIANYLLYHHERWDGKGYPKGLKAEEIPYVSRIISIADAYDAMTSERSYRAPLTNEVAIEELQKNAGIQFDRELIKVFIEKVLGS